MNIYEVFGGLICPILVLVTLTLNEVLEKHPIARLFSFLIFYFSSFYCIWYNTNVKLNLFLAFIYIIIIIFQLIGTARLTIIEHLDKTVKAIENEIKNKVDSCEMSIRTDIWHAREELGKDILNIPEKTVKTEMEFFGTVYDTLEDASKNKNKE